VDKFNNEKRIIQLQGMPHVTLAPTIFRRILRFLDPTMALKISEVDTFLKANHGGMNILDNFLLELSSYSRNPSQIEVFSLKYPYNEFVLLFCRIIGQESTIYVLYFLHHSVHKDVLLTWFLSS
jgi:hypothetical protein